jgi:serine kinase of HPr protein (carbohydrate metabolism regulator)
MPAVNVHATALARNDEGILIRGASGSGKSLLALLLIDDWVLRGEKALLVSDDRVDLTATDAAVTMTAPRQIAGLIELRGRGIVSRPFCDSVRLRLVVDLVPELERMPDENEFITEILGRAVPRCPVPALKTSAYPLQRLLIEEALHATDIARERDNL